MIDGRAPEIIVDEERSKIVRPDQDTVDLLDKADEYKIDDFQEGIS